MKDEPRHPSPFFPAIQSLCLSFPGAGEDYPWGDIAYKINGKMFACVDKATPLQVTVKADPADVGGLLEQQAVKRASYVGRFGWVTVTIEDTAALQLACGLIEVSYGLIKK